MVTRLAYPWLRYRLPILTEIASINRCVLRHKSRENSLQTSTRNEVDTNVKPLGEQVKETTKTASYLGVILIGVTVTGVLFYTIFSELFSSKSPNSVYSKAAKKCIADPRIQDALGVPIKCFGETNRRGRRRHVSHLLYEKDGRKYLRMQFHLKGSFREGTAQLEMRENESGRYEYRYLFVDVEDLLKSTIILEDNRASDPSNTNQFLSM